MPRTELLIDVDKVRSYVAIENAWDERSKSQFNEGAISARTKMLKMLEERSEHVKN